MPQLNEERRRFCEENTPFLRWMVKSYLSKSLLHRALHRLGSWEDIYQVLACEFCRLIASLSVWDEIIPNFMSAQLASKLRDVVNEQRNGIVDHVTLDLLVEDLGYTEDHLECDLEDTIEQVKLLINQAAEPTRTMCLRFLINGESYPAVAKDYNMTDKAVRSRVSLWILEIKAAVSPDSY